MFTLSCAICRLFPDMLSLLLAREASWEFHNAGITLSPAARIWMQLLLILSFLHFRMRQCMPQSRAALPFIAAHYLPRWAAEHLASGVNKPGHRLLGNAVTIFTLHCNELPAQGFCRHHWLLSNSNRTELIVSGLHISHDIWPEFRMHPILQTQSLPNLNLKVPAMRLQAFYCSLLRVCYCAAPQDLHLLVYRPKMGDDPGRRLGWHAFIPYGDGEIPQARPALLWSWTLNVNTWHSDHRILAHALLSTLLMPVSVMIHSRKAPWWYPSLIQQIFCLALLRHSCS